MKKIRFISFLFLMIMSLAILCSCIGRQGIQGEKGETGEQGQPGEDGNDGKDGHSPSITIGENGNWFVDGVDTGVSTEGSKGEVGPQGLQGEQGIDGPKGEAGDDGMSAYEKFKEYYPDYEGTEEDWITDIALGKTCNLFGHEWDEGIIITPAKELINGEKKCTCEICNEHKYEVIPMIKVYAEAEIYKVDGIKYVNYGSYPQTHVGNSKLIEELNKLTETNDRGYYEYVGKEYAKITASREVTSSSIYSDGAIIYDGATEWFIVEPIRWRIISENSDGSYQLYSEYILDIASFCDYWYEDFRIIDGENIYSNNYKYSSIRAWLNGYDGTDYEISDYRNKGFYDRAFNDLEKRTIITKEVDNSAISTGDKINAYVCENTFDKIYLLSYQDLCNKNYGFSPSNYDDYISRCAKPTDYAIAVGVDWYFTSSYEYVCFGKFWLRSPLGSINAVKIVGREGNIYVCDHENSDIGVRVACNIFIE